MEREQIIKALEICSNYKGCSDCENCPLHNDEYVQCEQNVLENLALVLIKELIEENEKLNVRHDPFPFCSISGCESVSNGCHKNCPLGYENSVGIKVARKIFEDIEKYLREKKTAISIFKDGEDDFYDGEIHALNVFEHFLVKLKKKYESEVSE